MEIVAFLAVSFVFLAAAYALLGRWLDKAFRLRSEPDTPAHTQRDGLDYEPARASYLMPQHFSAISAAGPIVGPILAAIYFGWGPAWLWILFGSVFIGGIHDFTALVASVRHGGRSVAEVVRNHMNPRAYILFMIFIWSTLVYVIVAFTDVTAGTFVAPASSRTATPPGPAVATSSAIYLGLAVVMGLLLRYTRIGPVWAKAIFLPLVAAAIYVGPFIPFDMARFFPDNPQQIWGYVLLAYCFVAAVAPVWSLLQPRGELGGYFLGIVMVMCVVGAGVGAVSGEIKLQQGFFTGWVHRDPVEGAWPLFPILFITVACGACSGFHSIVASGTSSKQLYCEKDARPVAYGSMLLEAFLACISLTTVMILAKSDLAKGPNWIYAHGVAEYGVLLAAPIIKPSPALFDYIFQFGLLCFATFVFDTLDACTRLARYVLMELMGWTTRRQAVVATLLCLVIPAVALALPRVHFNGVPQPLWKVFWSIFGSSNQMMAALTLLGVSVWLARLRMPFWIALGPTIFMMVMTLGSLLVGANSYLALVRAGQNIPLIRHFQFGITVSLVILGGWLLVEAALTARHIAQARAKNWED